MQWANLFAAHESGFCCLRFRYGLLGANLDEGIQLSIETFNCAKVRLNQFDWGNLAQTYALSHLDCGQVEELAHGQVLGFNLR